MKAVSRLFRKAFELVMPTVMSRLVVRRRTGIKFHLVRLTKRTREFGVNFEAKHYNNTNTASKSTEKYETF